MPDDLAPDDAKALYDRIGNPSLRLRLYVGDLVLLSLLLLRRMADTTAPQPDYDHCAALLERLVARLGTLDPLFLRACPWLAPGPGQEPDHVG